MVDRITDHEHQEDNIMTKGKKRVWKKKTRACADCGVRIESIYFYHPIDKTFCRSCGQKQAPKSHDWTRGENNVRWNGGQKSSAGYVYLLRPNHPGTDKAGYIKRANLVWAESTGHHIVKGEVLHHKDGDKLNDDIDNLELMVATEHVALHMRVVNIGKNNPNYKDGKYVGKYKNGKYVPVSERERSEG